MTEDKIRQLHKNVNALASRRRMKEALDLLKRWARHQALWKVADRVAEVQENYRRMLDYTMQGFNDPQRDSMYNAMQEEALQIADYLRFTALKTVANNPIYDEAREAEHIEIDKAVSDLILYEARIDTSRPVEDTESQLYDGYYSTIGKLFRSIWSAAALPRTDYEVMDEYLSSAYSREEGQSVLISALTISLFESFDSHKILLLLRGYESRHRKVSVRSIVGLLGAMVLYGERMKGNKEIADRVNALLEDDKFKTDLETAVLNTVKTRETKRIQKTMTEDIIPEIMKMRSELAEHIGDLNDVTPEILEGNPEWENILSNSSLKDKLKELNEMQTEGSDVMLSAFSQLKGFSFFNVPSNWFMPFTLKHPDIAGIFEEYPSFGEMLGTMSMICDSDKYSFALSIRRMPEAQRKTVFGQLEAQFQQFKEEAAGSVPDTDSKLFDREVNGYICDLYRFFTLFSKGKKMTSALFDRDFSVDHLPEFSRPVFDNDLLRLLAEFYFSKKFYPEAIPVIERLLDSDDADGSFYQKLGFAYSQVKNYKKALENYRLAELMEEGGEWLSKQMGHTYRALGKYEEAAECYKAYSEKHPDDFATIMNLGHALISSGNFEEAANTYYHAYYLNNDSIHVLRALAWAEFRRGNIDKSRDFYEKIILTSPTSIDMLNFGHLEVAEGHYKSGVELYRRAALENSESGKWIREALANDAEILSAAGIDSDMQKAITDYVLYLL